MSKLGKAFIKDIIRFMEGKEPKHLRMFRLVGNNRNKPKKQIEIINKLELIKE